MAEWLAKAVPGLQVFVPTVKAQADDGDFWRSIAPYRALELTITLTLGW